MKTIIKNGIRKQSGVSGRESNWQDFLMNQEEKHPLMMEGV